MGNFTKKPLYTYHDSIRTSDLRLIISIILVFALWLYLFFYKEDVRANSNVCNSEKCEQRLMRLTSCERFTKNKEKVIECASWKTTFARKQVTRFERAEIEKEITELYEKVHNQDLEVYHVKWDKKDHKQEILNKFIQEWKKQGMTFDNKDHKENLKDMLGTFLWENGNMNMNLRSYLSYERNWKQYYDFWICQVSEYYHPEIVNDKRFFKDIDFQVENCVKLYRGGTKFYWARHKEKMKKNLVFNK